MTDEELIPLLKSDPAGGLAAVIRQYSGYVMGIAYTRLSDVCTKEDMEEAVSDVFLKFYQAGKQNGFSLTSVRGFLSVIAARHCINIFRKKCREMNTVSFDEISEEISVTDSFPSENRISEKIACLNDIDRKLIIRRFFFGQKSKEIADELNMKPAAVDTRISRALVKLRKMMEEENVYG